jgi:superfamily I DNA/RNA helicase
MKWSNAQEEFYKEVCMSGNNIILQAVAGSGKTTTLIESIIRLIACKTVRGKINLMAFNKAVNAESSERLRRKGIGPDKCNAISFNSYGHSLVKRNYPGVGFNEKKAETCIQAVLKGERDIGMALADFNAKKKLAGRCAMTKWDFNKCVRSVVSVIRDKGILLDEYVYELYYEFVSRNEAELLPDRLDFELSVELKKLIATYSLRAVKELDANKAEMDYADQVRFPVIYDLVKKRNSPKVVFLDECQDLNRYNLIMVERMIGCGTRVIAVGDRHQAIYAFRGASETCLDQLLLMSSGRPMNLDVSYRCPSQVVSYVRDRCPSSTITAWQRGGRVIEHSDLDESFFRHCRETPRLLALLGKDDVMSKKALARAKEKWLTKIRAKLVIEHHIQMVVSATNSALLRLYLELHRRDHPSTLNKSGLITSLKRMCQGFSEKNDWEKYIIELEKCLMDPPPKLSDTRLDKLKSLYIVITDLKCTSWTSLLLELTRMESSNERGVELHTVHSSKGLEADLVYVLDSFFPSTQQVNMEYVALTRSGHTLVTEFRPIKEVKDAVPRAKLKTNLAVVPKISLEIEHVPESQRGQNLRLLLKPEEWKLCKKFVRAASNCICEACSSRGPQWPVECHERWEYTYPNLLSVLKKELTKKWYKYAKEKGIQSQLKIAVEEGIPIQGKQVLIGFRALCPDCHAAVHYGFSILKGKEEIARTKLKAVNGWGDKELDLYLKKQLKVYHLNSNVDWEIDLSWLLKQPILLSNDTKKLISEFS